MKPYLQFLACSFALFGPVLTRGLEKVVLEGEKVTITYGLSAGTPPFTHQWLKDGQPIAGATGPELVLPAVTAADAGRYTVRVSNKAGQTESDNAAISILVRPKDAKTAVKSETPL